MTADPELPPSNVRDIFARAFNKPDTTTTPRPAAPVTGPAADDSAYGLSALRAEVDRVRAAGEGTRNDTLFRAAANIAELINGGALTHTAYDQLADAARTAGLNDREIGLTLRSAKTKTADKARTAPERPAATSSSTATPTQVQVERYTYDDTTGEITGLLRHPLERLNMALLAEPCPPPEWLVDGRMTRRSLTLLGAKPGIGKSWTALDLAIALTTGRDWIGHTVPGKFRVLYIDVENGEVLARRRLQQLGADPAAMGDRLYYVTEAVIFPGGGDSRRYRDTLNDFQPDLVVIDTLASSAPSAEKDTEAMSLFLSDVWHRAREAGASVLVLAHLRKSQQGAGKDDPLDSFRGAGHLAGAASRAWLLDPRGPEKFVLRDVKTREFPACRPTVIELVDEDLPPGSLVPKRTTVTVDGYEEDDLSPEVQFQTAVLDFIDGHSLGQASTRDLVHVGEAAGMPEKTVHNLLGRWVKDGVLLRLRKGVYARPHTDRLETA